MIFTCHESPHAPLENDGVARSLANSMMRQQLFFYYLFIN
jgi:hypothetical protein